MRSARPAQQLLEALSAERLSPTPPGEIRTFCAGEVIFRAGDSPDGLYVIESGRVQVLASVDGAAPRLLATLSIGECFGELSVIDNAPRSATAQAETETRTIFLHGAELFELLDRRPHLAVDLMREFSSRIRALNRKYVDEVVQAERLALIGRFAASIVHDFKTPLTIVGLASEIGCAADSPADMRAMAYAKISRQVDRMANMLNELLEFSRPAQPGPPLRGSNFARFMAPLLDDLRQELAPRFVTIAAPTQPPEINVRLNPLRLSRVFYNLFDNAVEAMPAGGEVRLTFVEHPTELEVQVADTGDGIPAQILPVLFEPFATHGKQHGTGLGLSICKKIVDDHGGRIWATSEPGKGTVFSFTLPLAR